MTIPVFPTTQAATYAKLNVLPAPVTTGTTTQTFTDIWGEIWVAKNGVNSGNWFKARDVLHATVYRQAAYTTPTGVSTYGPDTTQRDPYSLWVGSPTFGYKVPVAGIYRCSFHWGVSGAAVGEYCHSSIYQSGSNIMLNNAFAAVAGGLYGRAQCLARLTTSDTITFIYYCSIAETGLTGPINNLCSIDYLGSM